jgi:hypothetical protein
MFIKVMRLVDGVEYRDDTIYECGNVRIEATPPPPPDPREAHGGSVPEKSPTFFWQVWLNAGLAHDRIVSVDPGRHRIYVMNDQGKTIDTY